MATIGFLHTAEVHVATFDHLVHSHLPGVGTVHAVEDDLLVRARAGGPDSVATEVLRHVHALHGAGADIICCTCSTIGGVAERVAGHLSVFRLGTVFRVDRPMARCAVRSGPRILVLAALESTLEPTRALIEEEAATRGTMVRIGMVTVPDAWRHFERGDLAAYTEAVAATARARRDEADAVVLAQASMAGSESLLADLGIPVLSSPRLAIAHAADLLGEDVLGESD